MRSLNTFMLFYLLVVLSACTSPSDGVVEYEGQAEANLRDELEQLYRSAGGDQWKRNDNWCSSLPIEQWYGIKRRHDGTFDIQLQNNQLTGDFILVGCENVTNISCQNNRLTTLDVSECVSLTKLLCSNNKLQALHASDCSGLLEIYCDHNEIASLKLANCVKLKDLWCNNNKLEVFDVSDCIGMKGIWCERNQITRVISPFFQHLEYFLYDHRYRYADDGSYTDNGFGWWYPDEPWSQE